MKKRLISLMLAGAMLTGVGAMSACGEEQFGNEEGAGHIGDLDKREMYCCERLTATNMIVAVYKKKVELHRADIYTRYHYDKYYGSYSINDRIDYRCSKKYDTSRMYFVYDYMPDESEYDILCEECFADYITE